VRGVFQLLRRIPQDGSGSAGLLIDEDECCTLDATTGAGSPGIAEDGHLSRRSCGLLVEYHWLEGQYDRLPPLMADLVRRRVAVITTFANAPALAAKAATTTIPIVFGVGPEAATGDVLVILDPGHFAIGSDLFHVVMTAVVGDLQDLVANIVRPCLARQRILIAKRLVATNPPENRRLIRHPSVDTDGAKAFAVGEPVANCPGDLGAIIGRPTTPTLDGHGDQAPGGEPALGFEV
jgi:hypothetical protein